MKLLKTLIALLLTTQTLTVLAWGQTGHRAIAQIAIDHLDNKTKKEPKNRPIK